MKFDTLEDKCLHYRSLTDYKLMPNTYVLCMLDGRSFSKLIKNKYEKPFDDKFIFMMNETAKYLCKNVGGCKFAYVQSDEITLVLTDFDTPTTDSFFGNRLCKFHSIMASMAAAKFNQLVTIEQLVDGSSDMSAIARADCKKDRERLAAEFLSRHASSLAEFDCKAWNVPTYNEMFAWLLYRQIDCIRNSKEQTAQTYLSHKSLLNLTADEQIAKLSVEKKIDWNAFDEGKKYGRFIYKEKEMFHNAERNVDYERHVWNVHDGFPLQDDFGKEKFKAIGVIPVR